MTTHEEIAELLGAYALDAVDEDEAQAIEEHLADCPRCRAEVGMHREVAALLGNAGGVAPEAVWERIAAELSLEERSVEGGTGATGAGPAEASRREGHDRAGAELLADARDAAGRGSGAVAAGRGPGAAAAGRGPGAVAAGRGPGAAAAEAVGRSQPVSPMRRHWLPAAVVALGALAAALAVVVGVLSARVEDLDGQVKQVTAALSKGTIGAAALAASLDSRNPRVELSPAPSVPSAPSAQLIVDRSSGTAFFVAQSLAPLADQRTYQLWSLVRGEPVSVGLLGSSPSSSEPAVVRVAPNMSTFMVTAEPEGGTARPTTPVLISGTLSVTS